MSADRVLYGCWPNAPPFVVLYGYGPPGTPWANARWLTAVEYKVRDPKNGESLMPRYWVMAPVESKPPELFDKVWQFDLANDLMFHI
jgi:hypothetical protein